MFITYWNKWVVISSLCFPNKIVAAFPGMHVSPTKHSYVWLPRKCDYWDGRTDRCRTKWSLCATMLRRRHKIHLSIQVFSANVMAYGIFSKGVGERWDSRGMYPATFCPGRPFFVVLLYTFLENKIVPHPTFRPRVTPKFPNHIFSTIFDQRFPFMKISCDYFKPKELSL